MEAFFEQVSTMMPLGDAARAALSSVFVRQELPKGRTLLQPGTVCDKLYFIAQGLSRTYYLKDGKDVTDWLSAEGEFAVSIISFVTHRPDRRGIELLEDAVLWAVTSQDLEALYTQHHEIERLGRLLVTQGCLQLQQRFDDLHFASAAERYQHLLETRPMLLQRVPLSMIASYLGMSPETLSRIRAGVSSF